MDIGKQRKPSVDAKYLHAFSPSPLSQNGQHLRHPVEGNKSLYDIFGVVLFNLSLNPFRSLFVLSIIDSAFKKIKILQEASLEHHPTTVSCPTPARRRHRTTFTQVVSKKHKIILYANY